MAKTGRHKPVTLKDVESFEEIVDAINSLEGSRLLVSYDDLHKLCAPAETAYGLVVACIELSERTDQRILERIG